MSRNFSSEIQRACALIELLVVIAIIVILTAMLLPTLAQAKKKGQQIAGVNNVRQQALTVFMYAEDNHDVLPPVTYENGDDDVE